MRQVIGILLGVLLSGVTSFSFGTILFRRLHIKMGRAEHFSLSFLVGSACFAQALFFLCATGLARKGVFVVIGLLAAITALCMKRRIDTFPASSSLPRQWKWTLGVLFVLFGIVYLVNALAPEVSPDGSAYHLPIVARYLRAHGFQPMRWNLYASLSQAIELLFLPAFSIGGPSAAAMVHFLFLLDLTALMICYGRRFGFPVPAAVAAFLVFASPVIGWDGTEAYIDIAATAILFGVFYLLQIWDQERSSRLLIPIGILAGAAYAAKYTAGIAVPYALAFLGWKLWRDRQPMVRHILTVCAVGAFFIMPWMIKDTVLVGNPVAPFGNGLFPNPYVHVSFEQGYLSHLRHYQLTNLFQAPWELTVKGEKLQGFFGPVFLLLPLALFSLCRREGRRLLFAGSIFVLPWFLNVGARFLIPALPVFALALALALERPVILLPVVVVLHAVLSWYATPFRYFDSYAPRIASFPALAALRIEPEESYFARRSAGYLIDRLIESEVPPGEKVFSFDAVSEAWTSRQILTGYYSAENETLTDILRTAMVPGMCPTRALDFRFPERQLRGVRAIEVGTAAERTWQITEFQMFSGNAQLVPDGNWRFNAHPNRWEARLAFDNSMVTHWQPWQAPAPGMFVEVTLPELARIDRVRLVAPEAMQDHVELQGMDVDWRWHTIRVQPSASPTGVMENLRAAAIRSLLDRGVRYLLVSPGTLGANDFEENATAWGIRQIGESGGTRLYALQSDGAFFPPPVTPSLTPKAAMPAGTYDDTDPRIELRGIWTRDTQFQEAYQHTLTYTNIPGASMWLTFTGNSVTYVYTRGSNRGIAEVWIDDILKGRLNLYASHTAWGNRTVYDGLGPGTHVMQIRVTGDRVPPASDSFVDLDAVIVE